MATLYPRQIFNNINITNPYNIVNPNVNYIKIISPQAKQPSHLTFSKPQLINNQITSPFVFEEEKTSINPPMKSLVNVNVFQRNVIPRQNLYNVSQNIIFPNERNQRLYPKFKPAIPYNNNYLNVNRQNMNIQRSNTVTIPRYSVVPRISQNYYNSLTFL